MAYRLTITRSEKLETAKDRCNTVSLIYDGVIRQPNYTSLCDPLQRRKEGGDENDDGSKYRLCG